MTGKWITSYTNVLKRLTHFTQDSLGRVSKIAMSLVLAAVIAGLVLPGTAQASNTGAIPAGTVLGPGAAVWSPSGRAVLIMQGDGNLVLYNVTTNPWRALFWSGTNRHDGACARMQYDGNLVVYPPGCPTNNALWSSGTWGNDNSGPIAYVQDVGAGALSIYGWTNTLLWNTLGYRTSWHDVCIPFSGPSPTPPVNVTVTYFTDCLHSHDWYDGSNAGLINQWRNCTLNYPWAIGFACNYGSETSGNYWETQPRGWSGPGNDSVDWMNSHVTFSVSIASWIFGSSAQLTYCVYDRGHMYPNGNWIPQGSAHAIYGDSTCPQ